MKISLNTILRWCCYMSLAIGFMPIVDYYCPWYITIVPAAIAIGITLYRNRDVYPLIVAIFSILGLWILTYWIIYRNYPLGKNLFNFIVAFIPCILAIQVNRTEDNRDFFEGYVRALSIFAGITCITTMIGLIVYPMASRELASGSAIYDTEKYTRINIGGYDFIYALVLLLPLLLWMIRRNKGFWRAVYIIVLALDVLCIYASQYTIALICVFGVFLVMAMLINSKVAWIGSIAIIFFLIINGFSFLGEFFYWASDVVKQEYTSDRLLQLAQLFSGQTINTSTSTARLDYYTNQIQSFSNSPLWGHNFFKFGREYVSGHSLILDILGGSGLLGFGFFFFLSRQLYVFSLKPRRESLILHVKATWVMAFILAVLNPLTYSTILTVLFMGCMCMQRLDAFDRIES